MVFHFTVKSEVKKLIYIYNFTSLSKTTKNGSRRKRKKYRKKAFKRAFSLSIFFSYFLRKIQKKKTRRFRKWNLTNVEFTGDHSIKTTYMAGEVDQDEYTVTCSDLPRPELYKTGSMIIVPVLDKLLYPGSAKGFADAKLNVTLEKVAVRTAKKALWEKEICFRFDISHGNKLQTGYIGLRDFVSEKPEYTGCANAELTATIGKFLEEVMKYISGERAQGELWKKEPQNGEKKKKQNI